jgi:hypothetical protein
LASGTAALDTAPIASGACAAVVSVGAAGVTTANTIQMGFNSDPTGIAGYSPTASGMLTIAAYPSADAVNFKVCNNTSSAITPGLMTLNWVVQAATTAASGTAMLDTSAIASGTCGPTVSVASAGIAATDTIEWGFQVDPTSLTGYSPSAGGMLAIIPYPTGGNVNFKVCNNTASSITPGAAFLNWRVPR